MHRVRMLQHFGIIPFLVFDGDYLPSKAATEAERALRREESKTLGLELLKLGKVSQAHLELQKAVDVTPEMAAQLFDELKRVGVQYIVAPYEADAQLAYLERKGTIAGIISEDSDLLVFGAKRLLTKLDQYGDCIEINRADFTACKKISLVGWSDADFRRMAILSGCDYLANINKMGLITAYRLIRKYKSVERVVKAVQFEGQFKVPAGYLESFKQAELTFLHQWVYCPLSSQLVMHTEPEEEVKKEELWGIGHYLEPEIAAAVACGDLHPMTKEPLSRPEPPKRGPSTPWKTQHPQFQRATSTATDDLKAGKPLGEFFKSMRTPLAELDPNSLTPSPSQRGLLNRYSNASWPARPTPPRRAVTSPSNSTSTPVGGVQYGSSEGVASGLRPRPETLARNIKRQRLCSDEVEASHIASMGKAEPVMSPFFASPETPSMKINRRKNKRATFNIFSDDSVEEAMLQLPDNSASVKQKVMETAKVDEEECRNPDSALAACLLEGNVESQPLDTGRSLVRQEFKDDLSLKHSERGTRVTSSKTTLKGKFTKPANQPTPLQRLGVKALSRAKSATVTKKIAVTKSTTCAEERVVSTTVAESTSTESVVTAQVITCHVPQLKGSEDLMVPDSEGEEDGNALSP